MTVYIPADWQDTINCHAARRHNNHRFDTHHRVLANDYWIKGLTGEVGFALEYGLAPDLEDRPSGDGGVDFQVGDLKIDVKTSNNIGLGMLVPVIWDKAEEERREETALVLVEYKSRDTVSIVGWILDKDARTHKADVVTGRGPLNHIVPLRSLVPLDLLHAEIQEAKRSLV